MDDFTNAINEVENDDFVGGDVQENCIEFLRGAGRAVVTFSQGRYITKIRKLAEKRPDEVNIRNDYGGCIVADIPTKWIKISPPKAVSEEQRERMRKLHKHNIPKN